MVAAIITAAGKNRRMMKDLRARGIGIKNKLLLDLYGKSVIIQTLENVLEAGVDECIVVLGHFSDELNYNLNDFHDERLKIIENPDINVELSETLFNGVMNAETGLCLCVAADQPTVSTVTMKRLLKRALMYSEPENIVSIMARGESGYLNSTQGLGMPFVCHSHLLKKYLLHREDNLNPILGDMMDDGVIFYGVSPLDEMELVNINKYDDYLQVLNRFSV
jgi:molybdenum cofactor cytidylyltransferase